MAQFKDKCGTDWVIEITFGSLRAFKRDSGIDLGKLFKKPNDVLEKIAEDDEALFRGFWSLCEKEAVERNVSPESFADLFDGDTYNRAQMALLESCVDFFLRPKGGKVLKENLPALLEKQETETADKISQVLTGILNGSGGNSPASPVSATSAPTPSAV